jgi:hypothetical protein
MRRAIAHSLLMIFSWMLVAPLFAQNFEANLPACCRRAGKHHCMMRGMEQAGSEEAGFASVQEKCPCLPESTGAVHAAKFMPGAGPRLCDEVGFHPAYALQMSAHFRILFFRDHQKRGPPSPLA